MFKPVAHSLWGIWAGFTLIRSGILAAVPREVASPAQLRLIQFLRMFERKGEQHSAANAFAKLGPSFIKFGQFLATRADVVGMAIAQDLATLQDEMPPFSMAEAEAIILNETGKSVGDIFSEISLPIAAASIAQVHKAVLKSNGKIVAVKLLRPDIRRRFKIDLERMAFGAKLFEFISPEARRLKMRSIVSTFESWARAEMDLRLEAAALSEMAQTTANEPNYRVPHVEWDYATREMLVMEWIDGLPLKDPEALKVAGHDLNQLAETLLQSFLKQSLNDGFFHADLHPGNLFVEANGTICAVDFGIMGRLGSKERRFFAEILWGFIKRDYDRIAQVHFDAGYVPATQDKAAFAQALRAVGEPIHERPASEISMAKVITLLFEITSLFGMETRMELLLLQKSMVMAEGLARRLNPNINIWTTAEPVVKRWIEEELGPKAQVKEFVCSVVSLARQLPKLEAALQKCNEPAPVIQLSRLPIFTAALLGFLLALVLAEVLG